MNIQFETHGFKATHTHIFFRHMDKQDTHRREKRTFYVKPQRESNKLQNIEN